MANYQAARALMRKGRNAGEGAAHHGESSTGLSKSSAKKGATKSRGEEGETKEVTLATAFWISFRLNTNPRCVFHALETGRPFMLR
jgi:hypothetical protein